MDLLATSSIPSSFPPVDLSSNASLLQATVGSRLRGRMKLTGFDTGGVCHERQRQMVPSKSRSFGFLQQTERQNQITHTSQLKFRSVICAAALNARCSAEQTQTVTREAPTITHLPGKEKSPELDDGGSGFPPRDDGDGGGGGGGGGGNWSGGFFFFGFLAFLGFLKDKESEGSYRDERRR